MDNSILQNDIDKTEIIPNTFTFDPTACKKFLGNISEQFTVVTQNIRSINKNFTAFTVLLERLMFLPDVLIFTECRLNENSAETKLKSYNYHKSLTYLNQNDGIVVLTKDHLKVDVCEPKFNDANCLLLTIDDAITIVALYRSPFSIQCRQVSYVSGVYH